MSTDKNKLARLYFILATLAISSPTIGAIISRIHTFTDGSVLTASQLNTEFNNVVDGVNSIDNANIATAAAIVPSKLSSTIAGDGIARDGATGVLSVNDDDSTLEVSGDVLRIKDSGVVTAKIADSNVTTAKIADSNVTTAKIADAAVTQAKRVALGQQISDSTGVLFSTSSTTFVDVTNLSVTITTTGRAVWIGLISDGGGAATSQLEVLDFDSRASAEIQILRDSTSIAVSAIRTTTTGSVTAIDLRVPPSILWHVDIPTAGTYTYKIQAKVDSGDQLNIRSIKLVAYEL